MIGIVVSLLIFFSAVILHECAHAFVAFKRGDSTAKRMGRLTLNPLAHIDPFGTILLPILLIVMNSPVLFGWAKPVPINFASLKNPRRDMLLVGLAGPMANLLLAVIAALLLKFGLGKFQAAAELIQYAMIINVVLAVFNLIPIPPLDGSRVLMGLLPVPLAVELAKFEPYGIFLIFALLYMGLFDRIVWPAAGSIVKLLAKL
jgi:Zn-dependent protease